MKILTNALYSRCVLNGGYSDPNHPLSILNSTFFMNFGLRRRLYILDSFFKFGLCNITDISNLKDSIELPFNQVEIIEEKSNDYFP